MTMLNVNESMQQTRDDQKFVSIIIPTFNESMNIRDLLNQIQTHIPAETNVEIIIVDDNSPDGTGHIVEKYIEEEKKNLNSYDIKTESPSINSLNKNISIKVIHRKKKAGLISALVNGIPKIFR